MTYWKFGPTNFHRGLVLVQRDEIIKLDAELEAKPMRASWQPLWVQWLPLPVENSDIQPTEIGNMPGLYYKPAWDKRAVEVLRPLVEGQVEILPLLSDDGEFFFINVINVLHCLDHERSTFYYARTDGRIVGVKDFVFQPSCLDGQHIFRLAEDNYAVVYVSDDFKHTVEANGLTGLEFEKAWD